MSTNKDDILNNILHQYMQKDTNPLKQKDGINNGWKFKTLILTQRTPHNNYKTKPVLLPPQLTSLGFNL